LSLQDIKSMTLDEIKADFAAEGQPAFRALQIYKWLHRGITSFDEMSDQSKAFRQKLSQRYYIANAVIKKKLESEIDDTVKYLFSLNDGDYVESVLMKYHHGHTLCISTQVGCKMNCAFCATGKSGFSRNLTASEMLAQIQTAQNDAGIRISNVVMMGMGEALDNYDNVLRFLELVTSDEGINIGMRHISLSTCGIVDKIYDLAQKKLQLTLSVSLHAPNDEIRSKTMPVNQKWGVDELLKACRYYAKLTGRRISFEYAMISGINDSDACASELASRLKGTLSHVNLIPVNDVTGAGFQKSSSDRLQKFSRILSDNGITVTLRRTLGSDINASCGQLRRRYKEEVANVETIQQK
jgi:23S rRNA (adenine2503-C2)-methyltransferase